MRTELTNGGVASSAMQVSDLRKSFGATVALDGVDFRVRPGSTHALLGENGAGKSTLVKILSGLVRPDSGEIIVEQVAQTIDGPRSAHRLGIQAAFQEMSQIGNLTVWENMQLPYQPISWLGLLRRREGKAAVAAHLEALGLGRVDINAEVGGLDLGVRQKLEIARALFRNPKILLLDESTSTMSGRDVTWLGEIIESSKAKGIAVIFISHRMPEVRAFCDDVTVLRNGRTVGAGRIRDFSDEALLKLIVGRSLDANFPARQTKISESTIPNLSVKGLRTAGTLKDISFDLAPGEILGIAGLQGMGQSDLFHACFGAKPYQGSIAVEGREVKLHSPRQAICTGIGINLLPEDRKTEGLFQTKSGGYNITLSTIGKLTRWGMIDRKVERRMVSSLLRRVQVNHRASHMPVKTFSGGNQQKIALAKWLLTGGRILMLYDPTRGVDAGTKHEIYSMMANFVRSGGSVLFFSTEIPELVGLCNRVLVMYRGEAAAELEGGDISEETIIRATLGVNERQGAIA